MRRLAAALLLLLPLALGAPRSADAKVIITPVVYTFLGACEDCTGTGVGQLALINYTPGALLDSTNFFSFDYTSDLLTFHAGIGQATFLGGRLSTVPGENDVVMVLSNVFGTSHGSPFGPLAVEFVSRTFDGLWCVGPQGTCSQFVGDDFGFAHTWAVPEPATLAVLGMGLLGLGAARRRRAG